MVKRILATLAVPLASAAVAWAGGYDFDYRSGGVGVWSAVTLVWAAMVFMLPTWRG